jgi:hypothetical protein
MKAPPVNVKLETPTARTWSAQAQAWRDLNEQVGGHPGFYPLTVKAAYVIGIVHDISETVSTLLRSSRAPESSYLPAYGVFASGIELIGRCVNGNCGSSGSSKDLRTGFKWLVSSAVDAISSAEVVIETPLRRYSADDLEALRHFAAHGQATTKLNLQSIDFDILKPMPLKVADGLERYWNELNRSDALCEKLAAANVIALRGWPVFKIWDLFQGTPQTGTQTITQVFRVFDWSV